MSQGFRKNPSIEQQLRAQPSLGDALEEAAKPARRHAERIADQAGGPWMPRRRSGTNQNVVIDRDGDKVRLVLVEHGGHLVEFGSKNNPPHAPLRRGVIAAGLKLRESR